MANTHPENSLYLSWQDSAMIPMLNASNILDYFTQRSNPFYDRQCNNEVIKMQHASLDHLSTMQGVEYALVHVQEPILYVIRQQHRQSPTQVTTIADYYIVAGVVYQAPDLQSVINSRVMNAVNSLESAFEEAQSFSRYHPSRGYWWEFKDNTQAEKLVGKEKKRKKEEPSSLFQRQRVDMLLAELSQKFPPKIPCLPQPEKADEMVKTEPKTELKTEKSADRVQVNHSGSSKPPPEKKMKTIR